MPAMPDVSRAWLANVFETVRSFPDRLVLKLFCFVSGHAAPAGIVTSHDVRRLTAERGRQGLPTLTKSLNVLLTRGRREPPLPYRGRDMPYNLERPELYSVPGCISPGPFLKAGAVIGFLRGLYSSAIYRAW